ncbi:MAG TPA: MFS transporter [Candidatus Dormibacteraeota bacterium]|nr:MFS transporter [Candidatus Dormibacteraeota bacterium]
MDPVLSAPVGPTRSSYGDGGLQAVAVGAAVSTAASLPVFLVGVLAVQIRSSLHFSPGSLGLVVAGYYSAAAGLSIPFARVTQRVGGIRVLRIAALTCAAAMAAVAVFATSWPALGMLMLVAGASSSATQPAVNQFLSRRVAQRRQGLAFGLKQSAVPLAGMLAGLAVPAVALTVGWRWAFAGAALLAVGAAVAVPRRVPAAARAAPPVPRTAERLGPLLVLTTGFGVALAACASLGAFLVESAVAAGIQPGTAGLVAALASVTALAVRVAVGYRADRRGRAHFPVVAGLLTLGAAGFLLLALGAVLHLAAVIVLGAILAFGAGWGWNGLFNFAIIRTHQRWPARATGITQTGGRLGAMIGPLLFGLLAGDAAYGAAWTVAGGEALLGAVLILVGRRLLQRSALPAVSGPAA